MKEKTCLPKIFIIEDDIVMSQLFSKNLQKYFQKNHQKYQICCFSNAIEAISALPDGCVLPQLIVLDVLLTGPDGFAFLNEISSYADLSEIPVVIVSSLHFPEQSLKKYNVVKILDKSTMLPSDLINTVQETLG